MNVIYADNDTTASNTTITPPPTETPSVHNDMNFFVIPIVVIIIIMILSALVYLMAKKRRMDILRHNIMSLYEFDSYEREWESINSYDNPNYSATNNYYTTPL